MANAVAISMAIVIAAASMKIIIVPTPAPNNVCTGVWFHHLKTDLGEAPLNLFVIAAFIGNSFRPDGELLLVTSFSSAAYPRRQNA
jgi:hypothetical protein